MKDRTLDVLSQYELEVSRTWKGRGVYFCDTSEGLCVLKEFYGSEEKMERIHELLQSLSATHLFRTDLPVRNQEGQFLVKNFEEKKFILKRWADGRECDLKNECDICRIIEAMAVFHEKAQDLWSFETEKERNKFVGKNLQEELEKRTRELKRVQGFIRKKQKKSPFEDYYLQAVPEFLKEAEELTEKLKNTRYQQLRKEAIETGRICHGEWNQHNILFDHGQMVLTNFEHAKIDLQIMDFFLFLRKVMEKQGWKISVGERMVQTYEMIRPISQEEKKILAVRLAYPEKLWKMANHYYHTNKSWIPLKDLEKLKVFTNLQASKSRFVRDLFLE